MKSGLELEIRQSLLYSVIIFFFFYLTGYFFLSLYMLMWLIATLEELDPDEVESEEELWPFLEYTYIETNWRKGNFYINMEIDKEVALKESNILNKLKEIWVERKKKLPITLKNNDVIILNEIGILKNIDI